MIRIRDLDLTFLGVGRNEGTGKGDGGGGGRRPGRCRWRYGGRRRRWALRPGRGDGGCVAPAGQVPGAPRRRRRGPGVLPVPHEERGEGGYQDALLPPVSRCRGVRISLTSLLPRLSRPPDPTPHLPQPRVLRRVGSGHTPHFEQQPPKLLLHRRRRQQRSQGDGDGDRDGDEPRIAPRGGVAGAAHGPERV